MKIIKIIKLVFKNKDKLAFVTNMHDDEILSQLNNGNYKLKKISKDKNGKEKLINVPFKLYKNLVVSEKHISFLIEFNDPDEILDLVFICENNENQNINIKGTIIPSKAVYKEDIIDEDVMPIVEAAIENKSVKIEGKYYEIAYSEQIKNIYKEYNDEENRLKEIRRTKKAKKYNEPVVPRETEEPIIKEEQIINQEEIPTIIFEEDKVIKEFEEMTEELITDIEKVDTQEEIIYNSDLNIKVSEEEKIDNKSNSHPIEAYRKHKEIKETQSKKTLIEKIKEYFVNRNSSHHSWKQERINNKQQKIDEKIFEKESKMTLEQELAFMEAKWDEEKLKKANSIEDEVIQEETFQEETVKEVVEEFKVEEDKPEEIQNKPYSAPMIDKYRLHKKQKNNKNKKKFIDHIKDTYELAASTILSWWLVNKLKQEDKKAEKTSLREEKDRIEAEEELLFAQIEEKEANEFDNEENDNINLKENIIEEQTEEDEDPKTKSSFNWDSIIILFKKSKAEIIIDETMETEIIDD